MVLTKADCIIVPFCKTLQETKDSRVKSSLFCSVQRHGMQKLISTLEKL
jgi:hypothetical protein